MKVIILFLSLFSLAVASTTSVYQVWQPISLTGTDVYAVEGVENKYDGAAVMPRPVVISGAVPEDLMAAIARDFPLASTANGYDEESVNLLAMAKIDLETLLDGKEIVIQFDVSEAKAPESIELDLIAILSLGIDAVKKTAEFNAGTHLDEEYVIEVKVKGAAEGSPLIGLETEFTVGKKEGVE